MRITRIVTMVAAGVLGGVALLATSLEAAPAKGGFNGLWSVVIVTETGICERAYRYPIAITSDGTLVNAGAATFDIAGKVARDGKLVVQLSHGPMTATGIGRLKGAGGTGQWSAGTTCAGTWTAERRS